MSQGQLQKFLSIALAFFIFASPVCGSAKADTAPDDSAVILTTVVKGEPVDEVAREVLEADPTAKVLVPAEPDTGNQIQVQEADSLNTVITLLSYANEDRLFFVSPTNSLLQKSAVTLFNLYYMSRWDLKLGRWTRVMQKIERPINAVMVKSGITEENAEKISPYISHGVLIYLTYLSYQAIMTFTLPHPHAAVTSVGAAGLGVLNHSFGGAAQINAIRKSALGYFSGFGWNLAARRWDPLEDSARPISRQAYTLFNTVRGAVLGYFIPRMVLQGNSVSLGHFALTNSPFLISAIAGGAFYIWGDKMLLRYPKVVHTIERFQKVTEVINEKMNHGRDLLARKWNKSWLCSKILSQRAKRTSQQ